jgi:hypothetical protein
MLCRADFGLVIAGLGAALMQGRKQEGTPRWSADSHTVFATPCSSPTSVTRLPPSPASSSATAASVAWGCSPTRATSSAGFRERNFNLLVTLFASVAFLLAPRYLLPVLPLEFFFLVSDQPQTSAYGQLTIAITACIFLATAFALERIGRRGVEQVTVDRRVLAVMLLAGTLIFIRDAASSPYRAPGGWGSRDAADASPHRRRADRSRSGGAVSPSMLTLVAERQWVYELDPGARPDAPAAASGVDAVVLDDATVTTWTSVDRRVFGDGLAELGFVEVSGNDGIHLYLRGG